MTLAELQREQRIVDWTDIRNAPSLLRSGLHLMDYSVDPSGGVESYAGLQAAIYDAVDQGRRLNLGGGHFLCSTKLVVPGTLRLEGEGEGNTIITGPTNDHCFECSSAPDGSVIEMADFLLDGPEGLPFDNSMIGIRYVLTATRQSRFALHRVKVTGTYDHAVMRNGGGIMVVDDCHLEATDVPCAFFDGANTDNENHLFMRIGKMTTPNGDLSSAGSVGLYIHPHLAYTVEGTIFEKLGRYGIYENGSPTAERRSSVVTGAKFYDAGFAQTMANGPSNFVGVVAKGRSSSTGAVFQGETNLEGCILEEQLLTGSGTDVSITGGKLINTEVIAGGAAGEKWTLRSLEIIRNDDDEGNGLLVRCSQGLTRFIDVDWRDETVALAHQGMLGITFANATVRIEGGSASGGRGSFSGWLYCDQATAVGSINGVDLDAGSNADVIKLTAPVASGAFDGGRNRFRNGAQVDVAAGYQLLTGRQGLQVTPVASGATVTLDAYNYDTFHISGVATIDNIAIVGGAEARRGFAGQVRLIADGTWATSTAGNIKPKTTAARTVNTVAVFNYDPNSGFWYEVA